MRFPFLIHRVPNRTMIISFPKLNILQSHKCLSLAKWLGRLIRWSIFTSIDGLFSGTKKDEELFAIERYFWTTFENFLSTRIFSYFLLQIKRYNYIVLLIYIKDEELFAIERYFWTTFENFLSTRIFSYFLLQIKRYNYIVLLRRNRIEYLNIYIWWD
jgi:hypothetical protein